jgi:hypothetical protein
MKEVTIKFRITLKQQEFLQNHSKENNITISDFLRYLIIQDKEIFNFPKEDILFFQSRFNKILYTGLDLNNIIRELNIRFVKSKSVKISESETESIKEILIKIDNYIAEIDRNFEYYKISESKKKLKQNKKIIIGLRISENEMSIIEKHRSLSISEYMRYQILNLMRKFTLSPSSIDNFLYEYEISSRILSNITQSLNYIHDQSSRIFIEEKRKMINYFRRNIILFVRKYD